MSNLREPPSDLWAVSVSYQTGGRSAGASWGERELFEDGAAAERFVLDALLDIDEQDRESPTASSSRRWLKRTRAIPELEPGRKRVWDLLGVWRLVDGEWEPQKFSLESPRVFNAAARVLVDEETP